MATTVGNVVFQISADLKSLQGQLRTMEGNFQTSFSRIESIAGTFGKSIVGGLLAGFSVGAITGFINKVVDLGDQLSDLSDQTGLSIAVLGGIKPVLDANNSSLEGFAKGFAKFQRQLGDFKGQGKEAAEALKAIKLDPSQLVNAAPDVALEKLVTALAKVENINERAAIAGRLLNKSAAELIPTILQLAQNGIPKLDDATAQAFKRLGELKDQFVQIGAAIANVAAPPLAAFVDLLKLIRLLPLSPLENLKNGVKGAREEVDLLDKRIEAIKNKSSISFGVFNSPETREKRRQEELTQLQNQRSAALQKFIDLNSKLIQQEAKPTGGAFKGLLPTKADVDKVKNEVDNFFDGLQKQLDSLDTKNFEAIFGPQAALGKQLDDQLARFKDNLRDKNIPIPKGLDEFFAVLRDKILAANQAAIDLNASLEEMVKRQQALADEANEGVGILGTSLTNVQAARMKSAADSLAEMRKRLSIEAIDTSTPEGAERQRVARIIADFEEAKKKIQEFGLQAGATNEETAAVTQLAWQKALNEIKNTTDEVTEFQRRAMERAFDAGADLLKDALGGQIKSWEDFGNRVKKVIDEIVADWLTLQAKTALFGPDFGKSGSTGQVGGLVGGGIDFVKKLFGFHQGGLITQGGEYATFTRAPRMHSGGEVPIIAQSGEFILNRWATSNIGKTNLDAMNRGMVPQQQSQLLIPTRPPVVNIFNPQFQDRKSVAQVTAELGRRVDSARRHR